MAGKTVHVRPDYINDTFNVHEPDQGEDCDKLCRTVFISEFTLDQWEAVYRLVRIVNDSVEHLYNTGTL